MIHAHKIAMVHTKNNFHGQSTGVTSRKQGFRSGMASPLVPVQSRTGTHGGIRPGS